MEYLDQTGIERYKYETLRTGMTVVVGGDPICIHAHCGT